MANKPQANLKYHKGYGENYRFLRKSYLINGKPCDVRRLSKIFSENGVGISYSIISAIENESREPTVEQAQIYHDFFNVPFDFLTGEIKTHKKELVEICTHTGLSGRAVEVLAFLKESGNVENIETINKIIESIYPKTLEWLGIAEISENERNNLFSALTWYFSSAFESNTDKIHVTKSGKIKDYNSTSREYTKTAFSDIEDLTGLFEINSGEIVEQVLLNKIIEELKKEKRG